MQEEQRPAITLLPTPEAVAHRAAEMVVEAASASISARGRFILALSGGTTPKRLYEVLADELAGDVDWDRVTLIFGDERMVPPHDPNSNYRMIHAALIQKVPIDPSHVLRVRGEDGDSILAATQYNAQLRSLLSDSTNIDLVLLGMGADGHTASLFSIEDTPELTLELKPGSDWSLPRLVVPSTAPRTAPIAARVSLSYAAIKSAERVLALVTGADKASRLRQALDGAKDLPMGRVVRERGARMQFLVDEQAGAELPR
jgi:6-phosphogluconolactonase